MNKYIQEKLEEESWDIEKSMDEIERLNSKWIKLNSDLRKITA